ncbi:MAG: Mrp/NBP35 family ATP-binding protein [Planctomycetota bacterium]
MGLSKDLVKRALTTVDGPSGLDLVTGGELQWVAACDGFASIKLNLPDDTDRPAMMQLAAECDRAIRNEAARTKEPVEALRFQFVDHGGNTVFSTGGGPDDPEQGRTESQPAQQAASPPPSPQSQANALPNVTHVIAVGAGKGGVGKSTISVNLAVALARKGHAVGLLDGDIYGPSLPTMLGLDALEQSVIDNKLVPYAVHGLKAITIGKLVEPDKPLIWRGPMAHGAFNQLITRTTWGDLDYLIIDLPPGTGDVPLTMAQSLQLTGAVVVCTPQKVAQDDAVRAARMFQQLGIEVLGVVENMSYFIGDDEKEYDIVGRGGAEMMAQRLGLPFLGAVPINTALRANSDSGEPTRNFDGGTAGGDRLPKSLEKLATNLESQAALAAMRGGSSKPTLTIS